MRKVLAMAAAMTVSLTAYGQGMTREQMMEAQARMQAAIKKAYGQQVGLPPGASAVSTAAKPAVSEEELAAKVAAMRHAGEIFAVVSRKDGFVVNGRAYIDPEGPISRYSVDPFTGDATYVAEVGPGVGKLKWVHLSNLDNAIEFGTANKTGGGWIVTTASGKTLAGELLILIPSGVLVARQTAAFRYEPGRGVKSVAMPDGFQFVPLQHGAVGSTDTVLLEKIGSDDAGNPVAGIGKLLGRLSGARIDDYAFFNLTTGTLIPVNIDSSGKNTSSFSNCRRKNAVANACDKMTTFESLYDVNGQKNLTHYYWRADWYKTPGGSYAVVQENGLKNINVIDLSTGKRVTAFDRGLGIAGYSVELTTAARIRIVANWAFQDHVIADAEALFQSGLAGQANPVAQGTEAGPTEPATAK